MYDATFFHHVSTAIHEDILQQAAQRYRVQEEPAARPADLYARLSAVRHLGQTLWRAMPARLSSGH
jgi:hypothetical protein